MIPGTDYSPSKAFLDFASQFFVGLSEGDFQSALGKLDNSNGVRWTKKSIQDELRKAIGVNSVCSPHGISKSASPKLENIDGVYTLNHRIPVNGKWSDSTVLFRFVKKQGTGYFYVYIDSIQP